MGSIGKYTIPSAIKGVRVSQLLQIEDERGAVLHMLRPGDDPVVVGEIYFSIINPGRVKAWKLHKHMTQRLAVPAGKVRLVLFDGRADSASRAKVEEIILGRPHAYYLAIIPPGIWYGLQNISAEPALIANCADREHDPAEVDELPLASDTIPYAWKEALP
jgi:dTDP-4-dehydrorhamnose 3,5-epimerase